MKKDNKPYHTIFSYGNAQFFEYQKNLLIAISYSLWIDDKTTESLEKLNELFYNLNLKINGISKDEMHSLGKKHYQHLSNLRFELENTTKKGLYNLHDIKKAFKTKSKNTQRTIRELK